MTLVELFEGYSEFLESLKTRVSTAQLRAARSVNQELVCLYWQIGRDILENQKRLGWGANVINRLSRDLSNAFPGMRGLSPRSLGYMKVFAEKYPDEVILQQVAAKLPWGHLMLLLDKVKDEIERLWYMNKALEYGWSRNMMVHHIELGLYKREGKAITNFSNKLPSPQSDLAQQSLKDPYLFDFLTISKDAHEREIEKELAKHIQKFLLELGSGFAFVGSQYHLKVAGKDFFLDLLFFHLKLRCYVVIELKADEFLPEHAGKMNFYLSAVDDILRHPSDSPSIGLILCKTKDGVLGEYALKDMTKPIGLAEYKIVESIPEELRTSLPTIEEIEKQLSIA